MSDNKNLNKAKNVKNDEYYTLYEDIEKEIPHYADHLKDKIIYCNCDRPPYSNFYNYFKNNFDKLKIKKLITTFYGDIGFYYEFDGQHEIFKPLNGDGDFRSAECIEILKQADIVITNPPFSLFREFVDVLEKYNKKYLIIGPEIAISYKNIFELFRTHKLWLGVVKRTAGFKNPQNEIIDVNANWFTNLPHSAPVRVLELYKEYDPAINLYYDGINAINVDRSRDIPKDYDGYMGVPVSFIKLWNPEQFELIKILSPFINGKKKFKRLMIRRRDAHIF